LPSKEVHKKKALVNVSNETSTERITGGALPGSFLDLTKKEVGIMKLPSYFGRRTLFSVWFSVATIIILAAAAPKSWAAEIPFGKAKIIIEFNSTGNDVGVQVLLDGEPWKRVKIKSPNGLQLLDIISSGSLRKQGLTELFFESSEPSLDEVPLAEFLARFPEGKYEFEGITIEGEELEGEARLTHVIPAGPVITSPQEGEVVDPNNLVVEWRRVTEKIAGSGRLEIVGYQVIVERTDNDQLGAAPRLFDVKLPATSDPIQSVTVPREFLEPRTEYKFEVLAIEKGGNQTITEGGPFQTQ